MRLIRLRVCTDDIADFTDRSDVYDLFTLLDEIAFLRLELGD